MEYHKFKELSYKYQSDIDKDEEPLYKELRAILYENRCFMHVKLNDILKKYQKESLIVTDVYGVKYLNVGSKKLNKVLLKAPETLKGVYKVQSGTDIISWNAFEKANKLTKVVLPEGLQVIGEDAFSGCDNIQPIDIPSSVEFIGCHSLDCKYNTFTFPKELRQFHIDCIPVAKEYFSNSPILKIENGCCIFDNKLFKYLGKGITDLKIPEGVVVIGDYSFSLNKEIKKLFIPSSVTKIDVFAFNECTALESVEIAEGLETIEFSAFTRCKSLRKINIPNSVVKIDDCAFTDCPNLEITKQS